ncbi:MAG: type II toxin-antitoxin system RelE/ParE family toxin [Gemmataceae bacterium]
MTHTVIVSPRAFGQLLQNAGWMASNVSKRSADRWLSRAKTAIASLANHPERCPEADEAAELGLPLRELLHGRRPHVFRILFTIDGGVVNVHHVRHAAQDRLIADDF